MMCGCTEVVATAAEQTYPQFDCCSHYVPVSFPSRQAEIDVWERYLVHFNVQLVFCVVLLFDHVGLSHLLCWKLKIQIQPAIEGEFFPTAVLPPRLSS